MFVFTCNKWSTNLNWIHTANLSVSCDNTIIITIIKLCFFQRHYITTFPLKSHCFLSLSCGKSSNASVFETENNTHSAAGKQHLGTFLCITNNEAKNLTSSSVFVCSLSVTELKTPEAEIGHQSTCQIQVRTRCECHRSKWFLSWATFTSRGV